MAREARNNHFGEQEVRQSGFVVLTLAFTGCPQTCGHSSASCSIWITGTNYLLKKSACKDPHHYLTFFFLDKGLLCYILFKMVNLEAGKGASRGGTCF